MINKLPAKVSLYAVRAYPDYGLEYIYLERKWIILKIQHKSNTKKIDTLKKKKHEKQKMRKRVETAISDIKKMIPRTTYALTLEGFLIKLTLFEFGLLLKKND